MKYLLIVATVAFSVLIQPQEVKMKGKYKMEYEQDYTSQNGTIVFDGDTYMRYPSNGKRIKGSIDYEKYFIILNDKKSNLRVKLAKREMGNDTIYFRTRDLNDKSPEMDLVIFAGKLIKLK